MIFPVTKDLLRENGFGVDEEAGAGVMLVEALMGIGTWGGKRVKKFRRRGGRVRASAMWW